MKNNILYLLNFILCMLILTSCSKNEVEIYEFVGKVGKSPATMTVTIDKKGNAKGTYRYNKYKKDIELTGHLVKKGLVLEEAVDGEVTGQFVGVLNKEAKEFGGSWINPKTEKSIAFEFASREIMAIKESSETSKKDEPYLKRLEGTYGYDDEENFKFITLTYINPTKMYASSEGWTSSINGGWGGGFSFVVDYVNGQLIFSGKRNGNEEEFSNDYKLTIYTVDDDTIGVEEDNSWGMHGGGFGDFTGEHDKINNKTEKSKEQNSFLKKLEGTYERSRDYGEKSIITLSYIGSDIMYCEVNMLSSYSTHYFPVDYNSSDKKLVFDDWLWDSSDGNEIEIKILEQNTINVTTKYSFSINGEKYNSDYSDFNGIYKKVK